MFYDRKGWEKVVEITERDRLAISIIGEFGAVYVKDIIDIYDNSKQYYVRRLKKLIDENYLIRNNKILYLGKTGKDYLDSVGVKYRNINTELTNRKRAAEIYKLKYNLSDFEVIPSMRLDRITKNFAYKYMGKAISADNNEYWLYKIGNVTLKGVPEKDKKIIRGKELDVSRIKSEIEEINTYNRETGNGRIRVMIFVEDKAGMDIYKNIADNLDIEEHIVIPYTESGIALVNKYIGKGQGKNEKILSKIQERGINVKLKHSLWAAADFDIDSRLGINFTTSDFNKEIIVNNYLSLSRRADSLVIVCSETQKKKYMSEYPQCKILSIQ